MTRNTMRKKPETASQRKNNGKTGAVTDRDRNHLHRK